MPFEPEKTLRAMWNKKEDDILINYPRKRDGALVHSALFSMRPYRDLKSGEIKYEKSFLDELEARGYDITTLKFSIQKA